MKKRVLIALVVVLALVATASVVWAAGGLVSYWPFEGTADDVVNANHGTIHGGPGFIDGKFGQALSFDGTNDYVSVDDSASLNFGTGDFTIGAWIKLTNTNHLGQYYGIFDKGQVTPATEGRYSLFITPWNTLRLHIGHPGLALFWRDSTLTISDTDWHYIAVSVDRDGNAIFAVDSTRETAAVSASSSYNTSSTTSATIGVRVDVAKWWFDGLIDEVGIWNRALSADEVAWLASPQVEIDIKPGSDPNCFNLNGHGVIPVAILSSADFDATSVDPETVMLGGMAIRMRGKSDKYLAHAEDVNSDGLLDLVVQIEDSDGSLTAGDATATLEGRTYGGLPIWGSDLICMVP